MLIELSLKQLAVKCWQKCNKCPVCNLENFILNYKTLIISISLKMDSHLLLAFWIVFKMNNNKK